MKWNCEIGVNNGVFDKICLINLYCFKEVFRKNVINYFFFILLILFYIYGLNEKWLKKEKNKIKYILICFKELRKCVWKKVKNGVLYGNYMR